MGDAGGFKPFNAYIVEACRTASGKKKGSLSGYHPADLGATVLDALVERTKVDASLIEDVIFGCVSQVGAQAGNIGRMAVLASKKIPESVPGTTIDRQCGSGQQAIHSAAQAVMSGVHDCVIAGGVEVMSTVPIGANIADGFKAGHGMPMSKFMQEKYSEGMKQFEEFEMNPTQFSQFGGAELLAKKYGLTKADLDKFASTSHQRAAAATKAGKFQAEVVPVPVMALGGESTGTFTEDEGVRPGATY